MAWCGGIADVLRGPYKPNEYGLVILPFTILRRLECVMEPHRAVMQQVLATTPGDIARWARMRAATGGALTFWNSSAYTLESAMQDPDNLAVNLVDYVNGFCAEADVFAHFGFEAQLHRLDRDNRLALVARVWAPASGSAASEPGPRPGLEVGGPPTLASEGMTVWAVPRTEIAAGLLNSPTPQARRRILGDLGHLILDDCGDEATLCSAGPYGDQAHLLEQAIRTVRDWYLAAGQALTASTLDSTTRRMEFGGLLVRQRNQLVGRKQVDHFTELAMIDAMVWAPLGQAYRSQETKEERAVSHTWSRHNMAHVVDGRQVNYRNAVQGLMLLAGLIDYASNGTASIETKVA